MSLAWPLVVLVAVLLAWHRVGQVLTFVRAHRVQEDEVARLRKETWDELGRWPGLIGELGARAAALEEWRQRTLNRNGGRE